MKNNDLDANLNFTPAFCPNPLCPYHDTDKAKVFCWYNSYGSYRTKTQGKIQRFMCSYCGRTCSTQTFSHHSWNHSSRKLNDLDERAVSSFSYQNNGFDFSVSYTRI